MNNNKTIIDESLKPLVREIKIHNIITLFDSLDKTGQKQVFEELKNRGIE